MFRNKRIYAAICILLIMCFLFSGCTPKTNEPKGTYVSDNGEKMIMKKNAIRVEGFDPEYLKARAAHNERTLEIMDLRADGEIVSEEEADAMLEKWMDQIDASQFTDSDCSFTVEDMDDGDYNLLYLIKMGDYEFGYIYSPEDNTFTSTNGDAQCFRSEK